MQEGANRHPVTIIARIPTTSINNDFSLEHSDGGSCQTLIGAMRVSHPLLEWEHSQALAK